MRVMFVLRSGGIYKPTHVEALAAQVDRWLPGSDILCLTDTPLKNVAEIRLKDFWPGWWAKMELFRPDIEGDILYFDLDTLIVGPLIQVANANRLMMLRDFYRDGVRRAEGLQSSVMFLPERQRAAIWNAFAADPKGVMRRHLVGGDQKFLEEFWLASAGRWQDALPGQIVSLKVHCQKGIPAGACVVCAHGRPKMWELPEFQSYYE